MRQEEARGLAYGLNKEVRFFYSRQHRASPSKDGPTANTGLPEYNYLNEYLGHEAIMLTVITSTNS